MAEKKDFIIKDKRIFSQAEGESKEAEDKARAPRTQEPPPEAGKPEPGKPEPGEPEEELQLPEINFATFIFSLNSSVLVHLGIIEDPASGKKQRNLALAKQTIDILGMLEEKTRGNLSRDEEQMLKSILYDLRMIYVKEKN